MIGIFDSGIGGLTVAKAIKKALPDFDLVYFGDTARVPYGNKSAELIKQYSLNNARFLISKGATIIVIACNSASAVALEYLKENLDIPVFGVIKPAIKEAMEVTSGAVGVIGTRATINSGVFQNGIKNWQPAMQTKNTSDVNIPAFMRKKNDKKTVKNKIKVFTNFAPLLVPLVEEGYIEKQETTKILKRYLYLLKQNGVDTLILGCTHYPLLKDKIQEKMKQVYLIDSADAVARELKDFLGANSDITRGLSKRKQTEFYASDITPHLVEVAQKFMGRKINFVLAGID